MMYLFTLIYDVLVYSQIIHSTNPHANPNPNPHPNLSVAPHAFLSSTCRAIIVVCIYGYVELLPPPNPNPKPGST